MKMMVMWNHDELNKLQYPIIVEMWEKVLSTGRGKRAFKETFDEKDIRKIRDYYRIFYHWYCRIGTPQNHIMSLSTHELIKRAVQFFASF